MKEKSISRAIFIVVLTLIPLLKVQADNSIYYEILRNNINDVNSATVIGKWVQGNTFSDSTALIGDNYYWVRVLNCKEITDYERGGKVLIVNYEDYDSFLTLTTVDKRLLHQNVPIRVLHRIAGLKDEHEDAYEGVIEYWLYEKDPIGSIEIDKWSTIQIPLPKKYHSKTLDWTFYPDIDNDIEPGDEAEIYVQSTLIYHRPGVTFPPGNPLDIVLKNKTEELVVDIVESLPQGPDLTGYVNSGGVVLTLPNGTETTDYGNSFYITRHDGPKMIYVDANNTSMPQEGTSWERAYENLQNALEIAEQGDIIKVAKGVYFPDLGPSQTEGSKIESFRLKNNVILYGGYPTGGGNDQDRDPEANQTYLSGYLRSMGNGNSYHVVLANGVDETAVLDGFVIEQGSANGTDSNSRLGGGLLCILANPTIKNCTFRNNYAYQSGGGVFLLSSGPVFTDCTWQYNSADYYGGAVYNLDGSPIFNNCTFTGNQAFSDAAVSDHSQSDIEFNFCIFNENIADFDCGAVSNHDQGENNFNNCVFLDNLSNNYGGAIVNVNSRSIFKNCVFQGNISNHGGGIYNENDGNIVIAYCDFRNNTANYEGGAVYDVNGNFQIKETLFNGNIATRHAGAVFSVDSNLTDITNCKFVGNSTLMYAGGCIYYDRGSNHNIYQCTFTGNRAADNYSQSNCAAIYSKENSLIISQSNLCFNFGNYPITIYQCNLTIDNSIIWSGAEQEIRQIQSAVNVNYCCIENWEGGGIGNVNIEPEFIDPNGPDEQIGTSDDSWSLCAYSPCINRGNASGNYSGLEKDIAGQQRIRYGTIDIGVQEVYPVSGDFEPDEDVDLLDLSCFVNSWLEDNCGEYDNCYGADIDVSSSVDFTDFSYFLSHWGYTSD